ncbi:MAG: carboxymuconolactone decarboxylase family protein [Rhodovarius sp.]|nr:carboxymuconolactone decarboxylase family protein [Rhodovarius sp.]MDW8313695.1 carboxymuconolactone decarboxylase family protein [Rhodovarius sp.]
MRAMARVPLPTRAEYPEEHRATYDRMLRERGDPAPHVWLALANMPNLLPALLDLTGEMRRGAMLPARLRELAVVMTARAAGSAYEFARHWNAALRAGARREQLAAIEEAQDLSALLESPLFDPAERAVLAYALEATQRIKVADATWASVRAAFTLREAMDLVMTVAWYNAVARINGPLAIELEPWFRRD